MLWNTPNNSYSTGTAVAEFAGERSCHNIFMPTNNLPIPPTAQLTMRRGSLYKYKSLKGPGLEHVFEIIRDARIYVPRPSQLNDPEECKPLQTIGNISAPSYRPAVEAWVRRCIAHRVPVPPEEKIQNELKQLDQAQLEEMVKEATIQYQQEVEKRYRILSLSDSNTNHHLWSQYADYYAGICLEFFVNPFFGSAFQVQYRDAISAFDITNNEGYDALVATALTKRLKWSEEREYRLVLGDPPIKEDPPLIDQRLCFPRLNLKSIIFGFRISGDARDRLVTLIGSAAPHMRLFEAAGGPPFNDVTIVSLGI